MREHVWCGRAQLENWTVVQPDVRFGSKADMCSALADVRFVPKADIDLRSSHAQQASETDRVVTHFHSIVVRLRDP